MHSRKIKFGLAALIPSMMIGAWWVYQSGPVNKASFDRVQKGMTRAEVVNLLGPLGPDKRWEFSDEDQSVVFAIWDGIGCSIDVTFINGKVHEKVLTQISIWQRFDDWWNGRQRLPDGMPRCAAECELWQDS
jgi:hypothetical protein